MNKYLQFILIHSALTCAVSPAMAQSTFRDTVVSYLTEPGDDGHDYWFAVPANYGEGNISGKYIRVYITCPNNTNAFVQMGENGTTKAVPVKAFGMGTFDVPLSMEMESSGFVENKAIHVYDPTDDISVFFMSNDTYSADGSYVLSTMEWGMDYVVAAFTSLFIPYSEDPLPSEFTVSANQDNTIINITPTTDCRESPDPFKISYPKGKTSTVVLNRGQSLQVQATTAWGCTDCDLTGTIIHSNYPIGVIGASQCTNIPSEYDYADFVCHSILPVSLWGSTYYSAPFVQTNIPPMPDHDSSMFLIVSSKDSQTIHRYDCDSGDHIECTIDTALHIKWVEEAKASKWYSDAPFMLVQYINSSTYPDGVIDTGDPAEVALEPKENYSNKCLFIVADSVSPQAPYDNYANVFYNNSAAQSTKLDTESILKYPSTCVGDSMSVAVVPHISSGEHFVSSDFGVSVYVYGYGYDESYSWSGGLGSRPYIPYTHNDSIAPAISFTQNGDCIHATIADSGSGIADIIIDSALNMSFTVDSAFVPGTGALHSFADLCDGGVSQFGYAQFTVFDLVGNESIGTVTVTPDKVISSPGFTLAANAAFDTTLAGTTKTRAILTIVDTSTQYSTEIDSIWTDGPSFIYYDTIAGNVLPQTITPEASHNFSITFEPAQAGSLVSHVYALSNGLTVRIATLTGIGYAAASVADEARTEVRATLTPNPAAKSVALNFSLSQTANVAFELSAIDGRKVFNWKADAQSIGENIQMLDISTLPTGSYIYRFAANGQTQSGKLIINR